MKLKGRAKVYAQVLHTISSQQGLAGSQAALERGARFLSFGVRLADPLQVNKALGLAESLALATNTPVVIARRERGLILYQFQLATSYWETYTRADLVTSPDHLGVGLAEGRRQIDLCFKPPHIGVYGTTGSGKTETVKSMLAGLFTALSPDDLQAVIIDLKGKYQMFYNLSHLHGIPIARSEPEIDQVLSFVNAQIVQREARSQFDGRRLLVVVDEAEAVFNSTKRLDIGRTLVQRGREVRVNGLFATQEPHKNRFGKHLAKLVLNRWVGLVDNAQTSYFITGQSGLECHQLTGEGDFIHTKKGGLHDRFQAAMTTNTDFDKLPRGNNGSPPEFEEVEPLVFADDEDEPDGPGRKRTEVDPIKAAHYLVLQPDKVTQRYANEVLGLGKDLHYRHRRFAETQINEIKRLLEVRRGRAAQGY